MFFLIQLTVYFAALTWVHAEVNIRQTNRRTTTSLSAPITSSNSLVVDLGYEVYEGYYNDTSKLNIYKGIRYAAPAIGTLRWQKPLAPAVNRSTTISATAWPPRCPQSNDAPMPSKYNFNSSGLGNEDCLFLSVFTPANATKLPVLVWIHGGGYGTGQGNGDLSELITTNSHGFIVVVIQYRLGAFGFLSSPELAKYGVPNAGLYDQQFSLEWIQKYISSFGGDPTRVTISGESAGGGAVMLQAIANGGTLGISLFSNAIVASPYLPMQWDYNGIAPSQSYYSFAQAAGCLGLGLPNGVGVTESVFSCLQQADTRVLQNASAYVSAGGKYGQWAFLPVTDGKFLQKRPSQQLLAGQVNGLRILSGNNADEGPGFVPQHITTVSDFNAFATNLFPLFSNPTLSRLQSTYAIPPTIPGPLFSTLGNSGPTALNQSEFGIGQQQRANNLYAETTFVCPSYWLASAYSNQPSYNSRRNGVTKQSWRYQYSVPPSEHGADLDAYYAINREALGLGTISPAFRTAVQQIWGRFVIYNDPTLPASLVTNLTTFSNGTSSGDNLTASITGNWPVWEGGNTDGSGAYKMLNLNMTGGHATQITWTAGDGTMVNITQYAGPGLRAQLNVVDAWTWEGGRGERCGFWASIGAEVPE